MPLAEPDVVPRASADSSLPASGLTYCQICQVELTSALNAKQHLEGKKHQKKVRDQAAMAELQQQQATAAVGQPVSTTTSDSGGPPVMATPTQTPPPAMSASSASQPPSSFSRFNYWCNTCSVPLNSADQLRTHQASERHLKRAGATADSAALAEVCPWKCTKCNKRLNTEQQLRKHFESTISHKHLTPAEIETLIEEGAPAAGRDDVTRDGASVAGVTALTFTCDSCGEKVATAEDFVRHMAVHSKCH